MILTLEDLLGIFPRFKKAKQHLPHINNTIQKYKIDTVLEVASFLAQTSHESYDWKTREEYGALIEFSDGKAYEFAKRLGNTKKGDGKKYIGRGPMGITGRYNYTEYGKYAKIDCVNRPELLENPAIGWDSAGWYWHSRGLNTLANKGDFKGITKVINGGYNGLEDRENRFLKALTYLRDKELKQQENGMD